MKKQGRSLLTGSANTIAVTLNTIAMMVTLPVVALAGNDSAWQATQVGSFPDANEVRFVRHHGHLFSLVNEDDGLSVYRANRAVDDWEQLSADTATISDFIADTAELTTMGKFKGAIYAAAVNTDGVAQLWKMCQFCRPAAWEQAGEAGFGDSTNSAIVDLFAANGLWYAVTENASGNGLFVSEDGGDSWEQVGTYGLGLNLTDVIRAGQVRLGSNTVHFATASGSVYQANVDDLTSVSLLTTFDGEITAMHGRWVTVLKDGSTTVYQYDAVAGYEQQGETISGEVTRFIPLATRRLEVAVADESAGASLLRLDVATGSWDVLIDEGFGNSNNTAVLGFIRYRGKHYVSTRNSVDGPEIYKITKN